jgi:hypothetical protein
VWTHFTNTDDDQRKDRLCVTIGGDFLLDTAATVNADKLGYKGKTYPTGAAGVHGGQRQASYPGGTTYGEIRTPIELGAGGGNWGLNGGGSIQFAIGGTATINGTITANGEGGGAPGGSVWVTAGQLAGTGLLRANAAASGGGGRVALVVTNASSFGDLRSQAFGGPNGSSAGAAGTVYREHAGHTPGEGMLIIDNNGYNILATDTHYGFGVTLMPPGEDLSAFAAIVITNRGMLGIADDTVFDFGGANLEVFGRDQSYIAVRGAGGVTWPAAFAVDAFTLLADTPLAATGNWTVTAGGRIAQSYSAAPGLTVDGGYPYQPPLTLDLTGNLTVATNGEISVRGAGNYSSSGWGIVANGRGGSHGGQGGDADGDPEFGHTYGSILAPTNSGSGGFWGGSNFAPGGGRMRLAVSGQLTLHGLITASSLSAHNAGSAGGSAWVSAGTIAGTGAIEALGRSANSVGGGGGRIAVYLAGGSAPGDVALRAYGGDWTYDAAAGTIYVQTAGQEEGAGTVLIDNDGRTPSSLAVTHLPPSYGGWTGANDLAAAFVDMTNGARVVIVQPTVVGDIRIAQDSYLWVGTNTLYVDALEHPLDSRTGKGPGATHLVDDYSRIVWIGRPEGSMFMIR